MEDLKGMVMGCMTSNGAEALRLIGASATRISPQEAYTPLERGTFQGIATAWGPMKNWRLYEVTTHHTIASMVRTTQHCLFNRKTWNKFTPEEQWRLEAKFKYGFAYAHSRSAYMSIVDTIDNHIIKSKKKHELYVLPQSERERLRGIVKPIWYKWVEKMKAKGHPAEEILQYIERNSKSFMEEG